MTRPLVAIASLGGTISMTPSDAAGGVVPRLDAAQLVAAVPGLGALAELSTESLSQLPSASLGTEQLLACLAWAESKIVQGARGVVLTQGTDTIEETAFFLDLYWRRPEPLVITGAMRTPLSAGADGPANLLAAVQVAMDDESRGRGVLVVMNDTVHRARWVCKSDSLSVQTFVSPDGGPAGRVVEGRPEYFHAPGHRPLVPSPTRTFPKVAIIPAMLGDDGDLAAAALDLGYEAIVVSAFGAGHVSFGFAEQIERVAKTVPVVIASRTGSGATASRTYGFAGSEVDLARRGAILAKWLHPLKARLLLGALLAAQTPREQIPEAFARWSTLPRHSSINPQPQP
ncbi:MULTISPECIES: asparaginase [Paraburkholderia]|uniref:asparaginase n=1 Tax=Paraburkholderia TaxID=1822464 RepID=UPI0022599D84|nr:MULTISPECIES: asparaginase [Paraburkholderia]MCX4162693.1 asparaginase [Paraburkholderia megapolitana]MDN7158188.1 asparaginase [Paraburkholderia sp. CHISQ3]MDQ6495235.1 asparaginase [Paraburkholderia megapolitana]